MLFLRQAERGLIEWRAYCNLQLRAYQAILPQIRELRATPVAVSPQTPDNSLTTAQKKGLAFPVLSDAGNEVARRYGLVVSLSETARAVHADLPAFNGDGSWERRCPAVRDRAGRDGAAGRRRRRLDQAARAGGDPGRLAAARQPVRKPGRTWGTDLRVRHYPLVSTGDAVAQWAL
jgi:hypothetical protein